jgi:hypothetical protein
MGSPGQAEEPPSSANGNEFPGRPSDRFAPPNRDGVAYPQMVTLAGRTRMCGLRRDGHGEGVPSTLVVVGRC